MCQRNDVWSGSFFGAVTGVLATYVANALIVLLCTVEYPSIKFEWKDKTEKPPFSIERHPYREYQMRQLEEERRERESCPLPKDFFEQPEPELNIFETEDPVASMLQDETWLKHGWYRPKPLWYRQSRKQVSKNSSSNSGTP